MSLKAFHVFFISLSVLLCWGFGWWCFRSEATRGLVGYLTIGIVSVLVGIGLVIYEVRFLRKLKDTK